MKLNIRVTGNGTKKTAKVFLVSLSMESTKAFIRASGKMMNATARGLISITKSELPRIACNLIGLGTEKSTTMATGSMTSAMVRGKCFTGTGQYTTASGKPDSKWDLVDFTCQVEICTRATGKTAKDMGVASITFSPEVKL